MRIITLFSLLLLCQVGGLTQAQSTTHERADREGWQFPLARFMTHHEPVILTRVHSRHDLYFPVPERYLIDSVLLHLESTNSNLVSSSRSQLRISLNDRIVAQIVLDARNPQTTADIPLPRELINATYNKLQFWVAQHYTEDECEDPEAPELWTQIDMEQSFLSFVVQRNGRHLTLSDLNTLMDEKLPRYRLQIVRPAAQADTALLRWGALIAQGAAVRLNYVPLEIDLAQARILDPVPGAPEPEPALKIDTRAYSSDVAVVGTASQLRTLLSQAVYGTIEGPFLGLYPLPGKPGLYALVVSGLDDAQVLRAARAFALIDYPLPDATYTTIHELKVPELGPYELPDMLSVGSTYTLKGLGTDTRSASGRDATPIELKLTLPPDLYAPEDAQVRLRLHLAYGASMRSDSVVNVHLNGIFEHAIALDQPLGAHYRDYRITIPLRSFRPGPNLLSLHPRLVPLITGECTLIQGDNLVFTLFADSTITFPPANHYTRLPDLELFGRTGFPFTARGDGSETAVVVTDRRPQTFTAAWRLLSKMAQVVKMPLLDMAYAIEDTELDRNILLVGSLDSAAATPLLHEAPMLSSGSGTYLYPLDIRRPVPPESTWRRLLARLTGVAEAQTGPEARLVRATGPVALGNHGLLMSYPSPTHEQRVVVAALSQSPARLENQISELVSPSVWPRLRGNVFSWRLDEQRVWWMDTGDEFYLGQVDPRLGLAYHFSRHPWLWIGVSILLLLVFAWVAHWTLSRYRSRRHPHADEMST